jgi:predicted phosphodiesterase
MKVVVIGDTHLSEFNEAKYNFLVKIINSSDKVIINGDFWEKWFITFEEFLDSEWNKLFPLLLSKNAVYISGNHDPLDLLNDRVKRFCIEFSDSYDTEIDGIKYHFEHGHRILKNVEKSKIIKFYSDLTKTMPKSLLRAIKYMEKVIYSLFPKMQYDNSIGRKNNEILKGNLKEGYINIFSDTHCPEVDLENNFANTGSIEYGHASYLVIEEGSIELKQDTY